MFLHILLKLKKRLFYYIHLFVHNTNILLFVLIPLSCYTLWVPINHQENDYKHSNFFKKIKFINKM